jgi:hypothetical protein
MMPMVWKSRGSAGYLDKALVKPDFTRRWRCASLTAQMAGREKRFALEQGLAVNPNDAALGAVEAVRRLDGTLNWAHAELR